MVLIYHKLYPTEKLNLPSNLSWVYLTKKERKRVKEMLQESKNNDLLVEMLQWFSAQHRAEDEEILNATQILRNHVVNTVRQPCLYQVEFLQEREKWNDFIGREDVEMGGLGGLSTTVSRPSEFITSVSQAPVESSKTMRLVANPARKPKSFALKTQEQGPSFTAMTHRQRLQTTPRRKPQVPSLFSPREAQSFPLKIQRQSSSVTAMSQQQGYCLTALRSYDITDEDASTLSDPSSEEEIVSFFDSSPIDFAFISEACLFSSHSVSCLIYIRSALCSLGFKIVQLCNHLDLHWLNFMSLGFRFVRLYTCLH